MNKFLLCSGLLSIALVAAGCGTPSTQGAQPSSPDASTSTEKSEADTYKDIVLAKTRGSEAQDYIRAASATQLLNNHSTMCALVHEIPTVSEAVANHSSGLQQSGLESEVAQNVSAGMIEGALVWGCCNDASTSSAHCTTNQPVTN